MTDNHRLAFGQLLRFWRDAHALSQQQLAQTLGSSTRHINRLENNHVHPSEELVLQIIRALDLQERDSNHLLLAAGYKPRRHEVDFNATHMKWLRQATVRSLRALEPYPSVLTDAHTNILMVNRGWLGLLQRCLPQLTAAGITNYTDFLFYHAGPPRETEAWKDVRALLLMAARQDAALHNDPVNRLRLTQMLASPLAPADWKQRAAKLDPMSSYQVPLVIDGETTAFHTVTLAVAPVVTASYASEPRLTIFTLYPDQDDDNCSALAHHELDHPLLYRA